MKSYLDFTTHHLFEELDEELDYESTGFTSNLHQILRNYGSINITKDNATETIQKIVGSEVKYSGDTKHPTKFPHPILGKDVDFNLMKPSNKIRMYDYLHSLINTKTIRGDSFEGLVAGLYDGITAQKKDRNSSSRWDVLLDNGDKISVKFLDSIDERPVLGNIKSVIATFDGKKYSDLLKKRLSLNQILTEIGNTNSIELLNTAFSEVDHFLFAYPLGLDIKCLLFEKENLISRYIGTDEKNNVRYEPKTKDSYQIRINLSKILKADDSNWMLYAPKPSKDDLKYLMMGDVNQAEKLFGSDAYRMRGSILNAILNYGEFKKLSGKDYFVFDYEKYKEERGH